MFYHVLCINRKETANTFLKKNNLFFQSAFTLLISSLNFTLLIMLLNNLLISLDKELKLICTHVKIKVEPYFILLHPKLKLSSIPAETLNGSKSTCLSPFCLSFLFHNNNSITINKFKK